MDKLKKLFWLILLFNFFFVVMYDHFEKDKQFLKFGSPVHMELLESCVNDIPGENIVHKRIPLSQIFYAVMSDVFIFHSLIITFLLTILFIFFSQQGNLRENHLRAPPFAY